jgi:NAD(P)-dependent dehydrogenase (short-subunit alcohol dehydrogenase family)
MSADSMGRFDGRVAIVTGGAAGIGRAVARRLVADGARVMLVDLDADALSATRDEIGAAGSVVADVADEAAVGGYVAQTVERFGRVDLFVNNAGIEGPRVPLVDVSTVDFDRVMAVNARGVFLGLREVMRVLLRQGQGGAIVTTASQGGVRAAPRFSPYIAAKHAVVGLTRAASWEGAPHGIRVNAVAPGHIDTRMARALAASGNPDDPEAVMAEVSARIPMGRYGTAGEVANLVTWLLSPEASYVSGSVYLIDAGLNA